MSQWPTMPFAIPQNHKFSLIAFDDCIRVALPAAVDIDPRLHVSPAAPFELPEHWREWIGTLRTNHFAEANLVMLLHQFSAAPGVLDQETEDLDREMTCTLYGLTLNGVPDYSRTTCLAGADVDGMLSVRRNTSINVFYRVPGQPRPTIDQQALERAAALGTAILNLYKLPTHLRLRNAFTSLIGGFWERDNRERLHHFIRSIDGLVGLEVGKSTKQFIHRGRTFASFTDPAQSCKTFYDLRSASEHLNPWNGVLDPAGTLGAKQRDALGLAWADAAERLATDVFRRVLQSPAVLAHFTDETTIAAFWHLPDDQRRNQWGAPLAIAIDPRPFAIAIA